jgi:phosphatidylglycerol lysyltransferase
MNRRLRLDRMRRSGQAHVLSAMPAAPGVRGLDPLRPLATGIPVAALVLAALIGVWSVVAAWAIPARMLATVLPIDALSPDPGVTAVTAVGLLALALGLRRGKRLAWWLALVTFASALIAQLALFGHAVAAAIAGASLLALALDRRRFVVASTRSWSGWGVFLLVVGGVGLVVETALALAAEPSTALTHGASDALATLADWLSFGGVDPAVGLAGHGIVFAAVLVLVRLPLTLAAIGVLVAVDEPAIDLDVRERAVETIRRAGRGALLPFQLTPDKAVWLATDDIAGDGVVVYGRAGRFAVVVGDPIGAPPAAWRAFESFLAATRGRDGIVAVYQASETGRTMLEAAGYRTFRIGHEAIVDLAAFDLAGSRRANLRHTVTRARRGGIGVLWRPSGLRGEELVRLRPGLEAIDAAWRSRSGPPMGFTIGSFDPAELSTMAIAVAVDSAGSPMAFATFRSTGRDGGMVLDLMRRLPGGIPGALEACIADAAAGMRDDGIATLSLGLAPLSGLDRPDATAEERALATAARLVRPWYDVRGLEFFKSKFDPRWEPRYVAVRHRADLVGLSIALLRLHLGGLRRGLIGTIRAELGPRLPAFGRIRA